MLLKRWRYFVLCMYQPPLQQKNTINTVSWRRHDALFTQPDGRLNSSPNCCCRSVALSRSGRLQRVRGYDPQAAREQRGRGPRHWRLVLVGLRAGAVQPGRDVSTPTHSLPCIFALCFSFVVYIYMYRPAGRDSSVAYSLPCIFSVCLVLCVVCVSPAFNPRP